MAVTDIYDILRRDEGLRLKPYKCTAGRLTIGIGRNLDDKGITQEEAEYLLRNDVAEVEREANKFPWYPKLDEARKAVVLSMLFNLGPTRFRGFANTIKAIERGDYFDASRRMLQSMWARQVGERAVRLARIMRTGVIE